MFLSALSTGARQRHKGQGMSPWEIRSQVLTVCECLLYSTCAGSAVAPRAPARASAAPRASPIKRSPAPRARFYAVKRRPRELQRPCWREARGEGRGTGSFPTPPGWRLSGEEWADFPTDCDVCIEKLLAIDAACLLGCSKGL